MFKNIFNLQMIPMNWKTYANRTSGLILASVDWNNWLTNDSVNKIGNTN